MKRAKTSVKIAIASALAISSTAAVIYAAPKINKEAAYTSSKDSVYLDVEKVTSDTVKVSLDNVEDIAKAMQFSIKLDGDVRIKTGEDGNYKIKDLLKETVEERAKEDSSESVSKNIFTDYTYNKEENTLDVIITSDGALPKTGNKVELFTLEVEGKNQSDRTFNVVPNNEEVFKYLSKDNKEYDKVAVNYDESNITLNTAPELKYTGNEINIHDGEVLDFSKIEGLVATDADKDDVTLEVRNITKVTDESKEDNEKTITEFSTEEVGTYTFKVYAVDSMKEKSEPVNVVVNVSYNMNLAEPTIEGADDVTLEAGSVFKPLEGVTAKDAKERELQVTVTGGEGLNLDPEEDATYTLTYTATDRYGKTATKQRTIKVNANKAPVITGVDNTVVNVGDKFDAKQGVNVEDDKDKDLLSSLVVEGTVNTSIPGEYKLSYSVTDSGNKTTRAQRVVRVNRAPVVSGQNSALVVKNGTNVTKDMILGGINITDETDYDVDVEIPTITSAGRYNAKITVTDEDGAKTIVTRTIVVSEGNVAELPSDGEENKKVYQVVDAAGIASINEKLSAATKEYKIEKTKKNFSDYVQYNIVMTKKEAVFRNSEKIYLEIKVPNDIESSTGGIEIEENVNVLATAVNINNKQSLKHYISIGDEINLTATISPSDVTNKELEWDSTNNDVVEVVKTENGVKLVAKAYGIATIRVSAVDGSDKFDEFTFSVSHNIKELPEDVTVIGGEGTEVSPVIYKTEKFDSLRELLNMAKDEYKVLLQDKKVVDENEVEYTLMLQEKGGLFSRLLRTSKSDAKTHYIAVRVPNEDKFEDELYKLERNDVKAPTLTYKGEAEITVKNGEEFEMPEVKATDNLDKNVIVSHVIKNSKGNTVKTIDTKVAGTYTITYSASDSSGNKSKDLVVKVTVLEADKEAPVFIYNGNKVIVVNNGDAFKMPEVTAVDKVDGDVDVTTVITKDGNVVDKVDTKVAGTYVIKYSAQDSANNKATLEIKVVVKEVEVSEEPKDEQAPVFNFLGKQEVELEYGQEYEIPKITATDNVDGEVDVVTTIRNSYTFEVLDKLDTTVPGKYTIVYEAVDKAGNKSDMIILVTVKARMVVDNIELGNGEGTFESPRELNVLESSTVENINTLIDNIKQGYDFEFVGAPREDGEYVIFKMKLKKKASGLSALFNRTVEEEYIEIRVPKVNAEVINVLNDLYNASIENPGNTETPDDSNNSESTDEDNLNGSSKPNKGNKVPSTGSVDPLGILGVGTAVLALGGLVGFKKKKK